MDLPTNDAPVDGQPAATTVGTQSQPVVDAKATVPTPADKPPVPSKAKKARAEATDRVKSKVWDHFNKVKGEDGKMRAVCRYCQKEYLADSKSHGTSNLLAHFASCVKYPYREVEKGQSILSFQFKKDGVEGADLVATTFTVKAVRKALAEMVIIDELPFRFVEGVGFRKFYQILQPKFDKIPSRITISRDVNIFNRERDSLRKALHGRRVFLTTDTWTSIQNLNYMCLIVHFIDDDWKLQKRIINFCLVEDHKGETIGRKIESCLLEWNIDCFFTLTVDNASSNNTTVKKDWKGTILGHEFLHMRCCAHILNLIVCDGLKELNSSIAYVRAAVRYVRSSPNRYENFKKCVEKEKIESKSLLCLDVPTRWNSTYLMLEAAEKFERAFERLQEDDFSYWAYFGGDEFGGGEHDGDGDGDGDVAKGPPNEAVWNNCRVFLKFLRLFYNATKRFLGSLYVTSNCFYDEMFVI
ncbi:hypothetical protein ACSBR1_008905 [Camellia fascicularis]